MGMISNKSRMEIVRSLLEQHNCTDVVLVHLPDIRWLTGFKGSNAIVVVGESDAVLLTDPRYEEQIRTEVTGLRAECVRGSLAGHALNAIRQNHPAAKGRPVGADSADTRPDSAPLGSRQDDSGVSRTGSVIRIVVDPQQTTVVVLEQLKSGLQDEHAEWSLVEGFLSNARSIKTEDELRSIRRAQAITDDVFAELLEHLRPGMTELDVNAEIVYRHLRRGAERMSFEPIVASGPNGSLPHARPTNRKLVHGDLVVLDMGCIYDGYASDMTRTVAIGEPDSSQRKAYEAVQRAQAVAIESASAGMTGKELDLIARKSLDADQLGKFFVHSLGHGVGLEVHEAPRLSETSDDVLRPGVVVTIEPGVYLPGRFGIRIEDMIVLREGGCENLTASSRELFVVE